MIIAEESESRGEKELDDINNARRQIHLKRGAQPGKRCRPRNLPIRTFQKAAAKKAHK